MDLQTYLAVAFVFFLLNTVFVTLPKGADGKERDPVLMTVILVVAALVWPLEILTAFVRLLRWLTSPLREPQSPW